LLVAGADRHLEQPQRVGLRVVVVQSPTNTESNNVTNPWMRRKSAGIWLDSSTRRSTYGSHGRNRFISTRPVGTSAEEERLVDPDALRRSLGRS